MNMLRFSGISLLAVVLSTVCNNTYAYNSTETDGLGGVVGDVFEVDELKYKICENNTVAIISNDGKYSGDIVIPDQVTINGVTYSVTAISDKAFYLCSGLTTVSLGKNVISIGKQAFRMSSLKTLNIGENVTQIGESSLCFCNLLRDLYCYAKEPPIAIKVFEDVEGDFPPSNITLHLPANSIGAYQDKYPWNIFKEIVPIDASGVQSTEADNRVIQINSILGKRLEAPSKGINIFMMKDGSTKKVIIK